MATIARSKTTQSLTKQYLTDESDLNEDDLFDRFVSELLSLYTNEEK